MKAPRSSVSGSSSANSSPPMRAATSMRRFHLIASSATALQRRVAGVVAVALVDRPKPSMSPTITDSGRLGARGALELQLEQLLEGAAVEQPGERVGAGRVGDARVEACDALALMHDEARQRERDGGGEKRSESGGLHFPFVIDPEAVSLKARAASSDGPEQGLDDVGAELPAGLAPKLLGGVVGVERRAVRTLARHRLVGVGDGEDRASSGTSPSRRPSG